MNSWVIAFLTGAIVAWAVMLFDLVIGLIG